MEHRHRQMLIKLGLGALVTAAMAVLLVPILDVADLRKLVQEVDPLWIMGGLIVYAGAYAARAARFRTLLPEHEIPFITMMRITSIHGVAVRIFPNPLGEITFVTQSKSLGVGYASSISTLIAYRALDFLVVAILLAVGAGLLIPSVGMPAIIAALAGALVAALALTLIILASFQQRPVLLFLRSMARRFPRYLGRLAGKGELLVNSLRTLREHRTYMQAALYSVLVWVLMIGAYGMFFKAVGIAFPLMVLVVGSMIQVLINTAPNIAGLGTMEAGWALGLGISGIPAAEILAGALVVNITTLLGTLFFGLIGFVVAADEGRKRAIEAGDDPKFFKRSTAQILGTHTLIVLLAVGVLLGARSYLSQPASSTLRFFETYPDAVVETTWVAYSGRIQKDGRTIDRSRNYLTTSEGQSYSLLRAVWMDDRETFDRVLKWTNHNLRKRPDDKLFAWLWGENPDGSWDVMRGEGGINTAADADQDIALALIFASQRWNEDDYLDQAQQILNDIWRTEVVTINGTPYLVAGNWAYDELNPTVNPSYLAFAAYPIFAEVDPTHPWLLLKDSSYDVLLASTNDPLDMLESAGIPPDWVALDRETGLVVTPSHADKSTHFSDDAFRVLWRVALDWSWHRDPRAREYLEQQAMFFETEWKENGVVYGTYSHSGDPLTFNENNSVYATLASSLASVKPELAQEIFSSKVASLYDPDTEDLIPSLGYYPQNWVWFGMALYSQNVPNLAQANTLP